ncbi:MAG: 2-hydroxyacyl-CoA dehydratase [Candidatus Helarchaeota archaeon]|nr:2-hydroxyacyl-CoA dehydratase [Candidatus Helarchaeota archaeon]
MENEKQFYLWDRIINTYETAMNLIKGSKLQRPSMQFADINYDYYKNLRIAKKEHKSVMTNFCFPPEIVYAMDCYPMCQEIGSVAIAMSKEVLRYIDIAEEGGIDRAQCNAQKVWIGASMVGEAPIPDYVIYGSQPCDSTNSQYQVMKEIYKETPFFTIDIPYWSHDPQDKYYDANTVPYVAQQLKNLVSWLEERIDQKMDHDHFITTMQNSNKTRELILEGMELMKAVPAPMPSGAALNNYSMLLTSAGLSRPIEFARFKRDVAKKRVKEKRGALQSRGLEEKIRVMWMYLPIVFDPFLFEWMERKFGAVCVMDMLGYTISKPINMSNDNTIFEGLARQILDIPMGRQSRGPAEFFIDDLLRIGKEYKVDCAIYGGHLGCKHSHAIASLMKEIIETELGIPCLTFEVDVVDSRPVTGREVKRKLKLFLKSLK